MELLGTLVDFIYGDTAQFPISTDVQDTENV